jgi:hypothetical protein
MFDVTTFRELTVVPSSGDSFSLHRHISNFILKKSKMVGMVVVVMSLLLVYYFGAAPVV